MTLLFFLKKNSFQYPKPTNIITKVSDILEPGRVPNKYTISDRLWSSHQARKERNKANGKGFGFSSKKRTDQYTNTLSARYYKDGAEILIEKTNKSNPRKLTPEEAKRLQGFPSWFIVNKSDNEAYKQFGNAVSVPVIAALAREINKYL